MIRHIIVDSQDRIVASEYTDPGVPSLRLEGQTIPPGGARLKLASTHEDYKARIGSRIIP